MVVVDIQHLVEHSTCLITLSVDGWKYVEVTMRFTVSPAAIIPSQFWKLVLCLKPSGAAGLFIISTKNSPGSSIMFVPIDEPGMTKVLDRYLALLS
jgi:hypothetical protein